MYTRFILCFLLALPVNISAYLLAPLLALFYSTRYGPINNNNGFAEEPRLPTFLWWYDTPDNSLLGDHAWKTLEPGHWEWRAKLPTWLHGYFGRLGWLLRNAAQGFELGGPVCAKIDPGSTLVVEGDVNISDKPHGVAGRCFTTIVNSQHKEYFHLCKVVDLGVIGGVRRCLLLNIGWRLKTYAEDVRRLAVASHTATFIFSPRITEFRPAAKL